MAKIVKNTTKISLFDVVCPHYCMGCGRLGSLLCECCKNYLNAECFAGVVEKTDGLMTCGQRVGLLRELVEKYKYGPVRGLADVLAELLDDALPDLGEGVVVVPLPTISRHIRERGFDHMDLLARKLCKRRREQGWKCVKLLSRANKAVQVGADASTRRRQARTAYKLATRAEISSDATYLLLDDVLTTGASMAAAEGVLRAAGAKKVYKAVVVRSGEAVTSRNELL